MISNHLFDDSVIFSLVRYANRNDCIDSELDQFNSMATKPANQFAMGRKAAHRCLTKLGYPIQAIGRGPHREPQWPTGMVGSLSHTHGLAVAVAQLGSNKEVGLGIDIERLDRRFNLEIQKKICTREEQVWVNQHKNSREALLSILTTKEAIFKAFFSLTQIPLGFLDVNLSRIDHGFCVHPTDRTPLDFPSDTKIRSYERKGSKYLIQWIKFKI